jgi:methionyl-tRNA synthetase
VGTFGNFCHRTLTFTRKHFGAIPPLGELTDLDRAALARIAETGDELARALDACEFRRGLRAFMSLAQAGNQYFDARAPWALVKTDRPACGSVLHVCLKMISALAVYSSPFLPRSAARLWGYLGGDGAGPTSWDQATAELPAGRALPEPAILFTKLDLEAILAGS